MFKSYLLRYSSDLREICVSVIIAKRRIISQTFHLVLLLLVYCSNYISCLLRV
jgi:hypothetical protein